jgi:hypothetical protein
MVRRVLPKAGNHIEPARSRQGEATSATPVFARKI